MKFTIILAIIVVVLCVARYCYDYLQGRPDLSRNLGCCMGCTGLGLVLLVVGGVGLVLFLGLELDKPDLPVAVSCRDSLVGIGKVLIVENQSDQDMQLKLHCISQSQGQMTTHTINIPARQTKEYGWLELNWQFEPGEDVIISHPDYKTLTKQFH